MSNTIADVAAAAGVSTATVDRALNGRSGVHARTRGKVMRAAHSLGYVTPDLMPDVAPAPIRLAFIVPGGNATFLDMLGHALRSHATARTEVVLHRLDTYHPEALAAGLREVAKGADGVGVVALDHPAVREAIRDIVRAGTRVLTLVSDISDVPRASYVGIDNRAAGRLAGHLMGGLLREPAGEIALFAGSLSYRGHEEREMGFRRLCAEDFPTLRVLPTREMADDAQRAFEAARDTLAANPRLAGIYCIGGGARGVARALEEAGRAGRVVTIGHELTEHTRRFLVSGTMHAVIDQDAVAEAALAVATLAGLASGGPVLPVPLLRIQAIFRENIPDVAAILTNEGNDR